MRILFIAPLPPPVGGQSLVSQVFLNELVKKNHVDVVNMVKPEFKDGVLSFSRIVKVFGILINVYQKKKKVDKIYLTISESIAGNIKDLILYAICFTKRNQLYIHLHGGSLKIYVFDRYPLLYYINRFFIRKFAGVIISGESHKVIFENMGIHKKISITPNFAKEELFENHESVQENFKDWNPIRLLYFSNMIPLKGLYILLEAFEMLSKNESNQFILHFAGRFDNDLEKNQFEKIIEKYPNIYYHGDVNREQKKKLFRQAHVFILPTLYAEGQPVSILEAYASGCAVITTGQRGILDIFKDKINGFLVEPDSVDALNEILLKLPEQNHQFTKIAINNLEMASTEFREKNFISKLSEVIKFDQ